MLILMASNCFQMLPVHVTDKCVWDTHVWDAHTSDTHSRTPFLMAFAKELTSCHRQGSFSKELEISNPFCFQQSIHVHDTWALPVLVIHNYSDVSIPFFFPPSACWEFAACFDRLASRPRLRRSKKKKTTKRTKWHSVAHLTFLILSLFPVSQSKRLLRAWSTHELS